MNYYERHLGDYAKDTAHLTIMEHGAYGLLLDRYYATECGIPEDQAHRLARSRTKEEKQAVDSVLAEFFQLVDGVWINHRAAEEITKAQSKIKAAQENGKRGGRPKTNQTETHAKPTGLFLGLENGTESKAHQTPDTRHQTPIEALDAIASLPCPVEQILNLYHEHLPNNPRCKLLTDKRRAMIRQRWREAERMHVEPFGYGNQVDGLAAWAEFFKVCADSDFLTGRVNPTPGRSLFVADLDFLLSPGGFVKTLENKYHRDAA